MTTQTPFQPLYTPGPVFYSPEWQSWQVPNYWGVVGALRLQNNGAIGREGGYLPDVLLVAAMWARDGAAHMDLRKMSEDAFRLSAIAWMQEPLLEKARELLSRRTQQEPTGRINVIEDFVVPLARYAVCDLLLGINSEQETWIRDWQESHPSVFLQDDSSFQPAFEAWLEKRMKTLGEGLIDTVIAQYMRRAPVGPKVMSLRDLVAYFDMLCIGAYESLRSSMILALTSLVEEGGLEVLRKHRDHTPFRDLLASAGEETLRFVSSFPLMFLMTRKKVVLGGQEIPAEASLMLWLSAANRDPAVYENPDQFDLFRFLPQRAAQTKPPLSFGYGIHYCLGAAFSRLVISIAIQAFVEIVPPPVKIDPEKPVTWYPFFGSDHTVKEAFVEYGGKQ